MKHLCGLLLVLAFCLLALPAHATFTVNDGVTTPRTCALSAGTCAITVASTTAGTREAVCINVNTSSGGSVNVIPSAAGIRLFTTVRGNKGKGKE